MQPHKAQTVFATTTEANPLKHHGFKRIIVCCDGTWQDGIDKNYRWQYSNILKIARTLQREDERFDPPVPQIVFYQSGIGSENNLYSQIVEGGVGKGLGDKIQDAYAFIAHNYAPGDEIFLFGFSRGAYTARMVADFIGAIGILDKTDMDHFAEIFIAYQKLGKTSKPEEQAPLKKFLDPFTSPNAPGKKMAQPTEAAFSIKCVGVFDTVGSVGLPGEIVGFSKDTQLFGFNNHILGAHISRALQALALNETRDDFKPAKFEQTKEGAAKGQVLGQCWFSGSHSDVGGGYEYHDLSDISLTWMMANVEDLLAIDLKYLQNLFKPAAAWGEQIPHSTAVGIFEFAKTTDRPPPIPHDPTTHETVHPSVLHQKVLRPDIDALLKQQPDIVWHLYPLERQVKDVWPFIPDARPDSDKVSTETASKEQSEQKSFINDAIQDVKKAVGKVSETTTRQPEEEEHKPFIGVKVVHNPHKQTWLGTLLGSLKD